ncbi:envelope-like protein [Trifolium medium]|uniref:Envelope-like protein n=1 Tax=Trifolium medium TaxID=97028 RepID=A0A392QHP7_9FABA|nr:envelope-like protein [Trifolium medium]
MLAKLIYLIGTKGKLKFGEYVFNLTMKQAKSFAMKLPIAFPSLITEIILSQHPDILHPGEIESKKLLPLSLDYKLLVGKHVPDIVIPKRKDVAGTFGSLPKTTKYGVLAELMEVSKALGETIRVNTERKIHVDNMIKSMIQDQEAEEREEEDWDEEGNPEAEAN